MGDVEKAEEYGQQRAVILAMMGLVLLLGLIPAARGAIDGEGQTAFGVPVYALHALLTVLGALLIATGGGLRKPRRILAMANDEVVRAHRRQGIATGFWTMLVIALGGYLLSFGDHAPSMRLLARLVTDGGEAAALLAFAVLELRPLRG